MVSAPFGMSASCENDDDAISVNFEEHSSSAFKNGKNSSFWSIEKLYCFGQGLERWNNTPIKLISKPLSGHSLVVGSLSYALVNIHNYLTGEALSPERASLLGFWHDAVEISTSDTISITKHASKSLTKGNKAVEKKAIEDFIGKVSEPIRDEVYMALTMTKPGDEKLKPYVKFADGISAYLECIFELNLGNLTFLKSAQNIYKNLCELANKNASMPAMKYYLDILPILSKEGKPVLN